MIIFFVCLFCVRSVELVEKCFTVLGALAVIAAGRSKKESLQVTGEAV